MLYQPKEELKKINENESIKWPDEWIIYRNDYDVQHQYNDLLKEYLGLRVQYDQLNREYHKLLNLHQEEDRKFFEKLGEKHD